MDARKHPASGSVSQGVTKQVLFGADERFSAELRYSEVAAGGYSALKRHGHVHAVLILRGRRRVLVGENVLSVEDHDLIYGPPPNVAPVTSVAGEADGLFVPAKRRSRSTGTTIAGGNGRPSTEPRGRGCTSAVAYATGKTNEWRLGALVLIDKS